MTQNYAPIKSCKSLLFFAFFLVWPTASWAQEDTFISIGGQNLTIGMSKNEVASLLKECCELQFKNDVGVVFPKGSSTGQVRIRVLGTIWFDDEGVSTIERDVMDTGGEETVAFARRLYRELLEFNKSTCTLQVGPTEIADFNLTNQTIDLICTWGKGVRIAIHNIDDPSIGDAVTISEFITKTKVLSLP